MCVNINAYTQTLKEKQNHPNNGTLLFLYPLNKNCICLKQFSQGILKYPEQQNNVRMPLFAWCHLSFTEFQACLLHSALMKSFDFQC